MMSAVDAAPSEDEFDALPDAYAGIDFDKIEALCGHPRPTTPSSEYLFDDLDEATLAEIDAIEARALQSVDATGTRPGQKIALTPLISLSRNSIDTRQRVGALEGACLSAYAYF